MIQKTPYNGLTTEGGAMARTRGYNRFHRFLARQKRRSLRSVLPRFQMENDTHGAQIDHSRTMLINIKGREAQLDLMEADA